MSEPLREDEPADTSIGDTSIGDTSIGDTDYSDPEAPGPGMPPPTAVESLVNALLEAGPEVAEHVVKAAQELLLAVQAIVDAADRAVQEQQTIRTDRGDRAGGADDAGDAARDDEAEVRHLDLAD